MKQFLLTLTLVSCSTLISAQDFLIFTTLEKDVNDKYSTESLKNNAAIGYKINDSYMLGVTTVDAVEDYTNPTTNKIITDGEVASETQFFVRYYASKRLFYSLVTPYQTNKSSNSKAIDHCRLGIGYGIKLWKNINIETRYSILYKKNYLDERRGAFKLGITLTL